MILLLFRRKLFKKNSRAISGIIATIFMVLVVLFLYSNVFIFILNENSSFQEEVNDVNQENIYRDSEKIVTSNVTWTLGEDQVLITALIRNEGPVSVELVNLWVVDTNDLCHGYNDTLSISLKPGNEAFFTGTDALRVNLDISYTSGIFTSWFVTARGNLISLERDQEVVVADVAQGIGSMSLDIEKFRYFTFESDTKLANYPLGNITFNIPKNTYIAFGCYLTNLDPSMQTIIIDSHSLFWQPGRPSVAEGTWFIVNVNADGTVSESYSSISLLHGETKMLVFASQNDLGLGGFSKLRTANVVTSVASYLLLHGSVGSNGYAQNIPFVALFYC